MNSSEIRSSFIEFFKKKKHTFIQSSSVVPNNDPTLLFTNAGMNQFKPIFLNETLPDNIRAVNSQKCIRVSGKHNDLEEVGVDKFHHTFFEMLGNWSFGDYYKEDSIKWAWELLTETWKLDKSRLWVSVYQEDQEAYDLWLNQTDIAEDRIVKCDDKENFWEMGNTGPCGPCSEIHYFVGKDVEKQHSNGVNNSDQYWELWNLVFIQFNRLEDGSLDELKSKHVDTGAGLERISSVLQGKRSNYDTDLFCSIINKIEHLSDVKYNHDSIPHCVIADHIRMLCFSIADGALPSNEGRGYVLRRILRRASRFGQKIGLKEPFLYKLVKEVKNLMGDVYPELSERYSHIKKVIYAEEESFGKTLDRGIRHFDKVVSNLKGRHISGENAFKLYDTYGFPLDLTVLMAKEKNVIVDEVGFQKSMQVQKNRAKKTANFKIDKSKIKWNIISKGIHSKFSGYTEYISESKIKQYAFNKGKILVILEKTPFYAESGGQVGDKGTIEGEGLGLKVLDVQKQGDKFVHVCEGDFIKTESVTCKVSTERRKAVMRNHTATHLMHRALKQVLGNHVNQAGSLVHPDYLRFDLTHFEKINFKEVQEIENIVNYQILKNLKLDVSIEKFDVAKEMGAEALFGEKYGEEVRVVKVGKFSNELCGGTHVNRTGDIGSFKILEETSLASGVRRIHAITGKKSIMKMQENALILNELQTMINAPTSEIIERVQIISNEKKQLEKKIKNKQKSKAHLNLLEGAETIGNHSIIVKNVLIEDQNELKSLGDQLFEKISSGIGVLFNNTLEKSSAVIVVSKNLNSTGISAGKIAKKIGHLMKGGGGGKPHLATAGGKKDISIDKIMEESKLIIIKILNG
jgi:alanyl-tRNA synthetase